MYLMRFWHRKVYTKIWYSSKFLWILSFFMIFWAQSLLIPPIYILLTPVQEIRFLEINQLHQSRNISHREKNTENKKISKFTNRTKRIDFRINKSDWFVEINSPSRQHCRQHCRLNIFYKDRDNQNPYLGGLKKVLFKGHWTRSASTSKNALSGLSVSDIL